MSLPTPPHATPPRADEVYRVPYRERAAEARVFAKEHGIAPASTDARRVCLLLVDCQNTFCLPEFELFVGGRSGRGAVEDTTRIVDLVYRNLGEITEIIPTLDTHTQVQIFHPAFWEDAGGERPEGGATIIALADVDSGRWRVSPSAAHALGCDLGWLARQARHYVARLEESGRYPLTIWPYHAMLGGIGHALVPAIEEAVFFHSVARDTAPRLVVKGENPYTEHYSALSPEVLENADNMPLGQVNHALIEHMLDFDVLLVAGQAKSHCVAWTVEDLVRVAGRYAPSRTPRIRLLEDCTSPVVVPGVIDFSDRADEAFARFAEAGVRIANSSDADLLAG